MGLKSSIVPTIDAHKTKIHATMQESMVRIHERGFSFTGQNFFLGNEPPPECIPCNCPLTMKHLLIECVDFNDVRQRFYQVPSLQDLFKTVKPEVILDFLKAAVLYRLLWVVWMFDCFCLNVW